jgi:ribosomal protein S10
MSYQLKASTSNLKSLFVLENLLKESISDIKIVILPKKNKKFVLLKSPHVNKKSKEHYQYLRFNRLYYITCESLPIFKKILLKLPNDLNIVLKTKI